MNSEEKIFPDREWPIYLNLHNCLIINNIRQRYSFCIVKFTARTQLKHILKLKRTCYENFIVNCPSFINYWFVYVSCIFFQIG